MSYEGIKVSSNSWNIRDFNEAHQCNQTYILIRSFTRGEKCDEQSIDQETIQTTKGGSIEGGITKVEGARAINLCLEGSLRAVCMEAG